MRPPDGMPDEVLIQKSKNGDLEAFEQLVRRYESKVYTIAYRFMGNHADALDLAQETFLRLYQALPGFRGESSFMTWLYRIAANACRDEIRRQQKHGLLSLDGGNSGGGEAAAGDCCTARHNLGAAIVSPEEALERRELNEAIQKCLNSLSPEHRLVLVMREIQGMSYEEIAGVMNCSLGTVKSRLNRARHSFKEKFHEKWELLSRNSRLP